LLTNHLIKTKMSLRRDKIINHLTIINYENFHY